MAKRQMPSPQPIPSREATNQTLPVAPIEPTTTEISDRAFTATTVYQEIFARGDDHYYAQHWGINE